MKIIVAVDENWAIGCGNKLLHSIPEDMKYFRETTMHQVVVMGRSTLESFPGGKPLKNRVNIVLSRQESLQEEVILCHEIEEVLEVLRKYSDLEVYIIGGETVYRQFLPYCESCLVTKMKASYPADKFFENLDAHPDWERTKEECYQTEEKLEYCFCEYRNQRWNG